MPSAAKGYEMYNARFDNDGKDHDTYFRRDEKSGEYVLKDGYEERFLGSGDYVNDGNALTTFSNDYDDLWDSYEPDRDKKVYGIYKKSEPKTVYKDKPTESQPDAAKPAASTAPKEYSYSPEIDQAQKTVDEYKEKVKTGEISRSIYTSPTSEQEAQSFFDMKKYQFKAK